MPAIKMSKSNLIKSAVVVAAATLSLHAAAAGVQKPGIYVGGGLTDTTFEIDGVSGDASPTALFARIGYQINEYIAAEARLGGGLDSDKFHGIKTEIEDFYGAYAKVGVPTTVGLYPYALVGLTHGELKASYGGYSDKQDDSDVSFGIGVDYWFDSNFSIGVEYMKYLETSDYKITGLSIGGNYKF
jgi:opacity protein-like surface antigen